MTSSSRPVTSGSSSTPLMTGAGEPVGHVITLEYTMNLYSDYLVSPKVRVHVSVTAQVQSPDRKQMLHSATWTCCGDRYDFVQMGSTSAAAFQGADRRCCSGVLGEAIPYRSPW